MKRLAIILLATLGVVSCSNRVPADAVRCNHVPAMSPSYEGVTVPCNIAPLTFSITDRADACVTRLSSPSGNVLVLRGNLVRPGVKAWKKLVSGDKVTVEVFEKKSGKWSAMSPFDIYVASDPIDAYVTYRLIEPTYEMSGDMSIEQRDLSGFRTEEIYNNKLDLDDKSRQCINCHSYQNYGSSKMQFHVRQKDGGTVIMRDGKIRKYNLKAEGLLSAGVYPSWHPTEPLIAYSLNKTNQYFFSEGRQAAEVVDSYSDIVLFDLDAGAIKTVSDDPDDLESFPYWAPDGKSLYYCCASTDSIARSGESGNISNSYAEVRYNLMCKDFDPVSRTFGETRMIFDAAGMGMSATFPRESPTEPYLLFTMAPFGNFHIWHKDADLYLMDLKTGEYRPMDEINSPDVESYHSWSSNGRWIIFSSRRDDGRYTRLYIAYFDRNGTAHKPFILPQADPRHDARLFKSYNIPEFTKEQVSYRPKQILKTVKEPADEINTL